MVIFLCFSIYLFIATASGVDGQGCAPCKVMILSVVPDYIFAMASHIDAPHREVGGWGRDPKKCTGRDWGMGLSTI